MAKGAYSRPLVSESWRDVGKLSRACCRNRRDERRSTVVLVKYSRAFLFWWLACLYCTVLESSSDKSRFAVCKEEKLGSLFCYGSRLRLFMTAISRPIASQGPSHLRSSPISLVPVVSSLSPHVHNRDLSHTKPTTLSCHREVNITYVILI
jgi:hypothetical protein